MILHPGGQVSLGKKGISHGSIGVITAGPCPPPDEIEDAERADDKESVDPQLNAGEMAGDVLEDDSSFVIKEEDEEYVRAGESMYEDPEEGTEGGIISDEILSRIHCFVFHALIPADDDADTEPRSIDCDTALAVGVSAADAIE